MAPPASPLEHLSAVQDVVREASRRGEIDATVADWLDAGIVAYRAGRLTLEKALNLAGGGGRRRPLTEAWVKERDFHLREAWKLMPKSGTKHLREAIRRWPRFKNPEGVSNADASIIKKHLSKAFSMINVPTSNSQLHDICTRSDDSSD